jgi:hypothetical protein
MIGNVIIESQVACGSIIPAVVKTPCIPDEIYWKEDA